MAGIAGQPAPAAAQQVDLRKSISFVTSAVSSSEDLARDDFTPTAPDLAHNALLHLRNSGRRPGLVIKDHTAASTLVEVLRVLMEEPRGSQPWGAVEIFAHSDERVSEFALGKHPSLQSPHLRRWVEFAHALWMKQAPEGWWWWDEFDALISAPEREVLDRWIENLRSATPCVDGSTRVVLQLCHLGRNAPVLAAVRAIFGGLASVEAPITYSFPSNFDFQYGRTYHIPLRARRDLPNPALKPYALDELKAIAEHEDPWVGRIDCAEYALDAYLMEMTKTDPERPEVVSQPHVVLHRRYFRKRRVLRFEADAPALDEALGAFSRAWALAREGGATIPALASIPEADRRTLDPLMKGPWPPDPRRRTRLLEHPGMMAFMLKRDGAVKSLLIAAMRLAAYPDLLGVHVDVGRPSSGKALSNGPDPIALLSGIPFGSFDGEGLTYNIGFEMIWERLHIIDKHTMEREDVPGQANRYAGFPRWASAPDLTVDVVRTLTEFVMTDRHKMKDPGQADGIGTPDGQWVPNGVYEAEWLEPIAPFAGDVFPWVKRPGWLFGGFDSGRMPLSDWEEPPPFIIGINGERIPLRRL